MNVINIENLKPKGWNTAKFEGFNYGANTSFFVVNSAPGRVLINIAILMKKLLLFLMEILK